MPTLTPAQRKRARKNLNRKILSHEWRDYSNCRG